MAIEKLLAIVPPPKTPDESGSLADLKEVESRMGIELPTDYREFALQYGSGFFIGTYLKICNPFTIDIVKLSSDPTDQAQAIYESGYVPWPPFPLVPGTLHFGFNENGDSLFFLVDGDRDEWPIIVVPHSRDRSGFERWEMPLGTFLAKALSNTIESCAVHTNNEPVESYERQFTQYSSLWDYRNGEWRPKRKHS